MSNVLNNIHIKYDTVTDRSGFIGKQMVDSRCFAKL